MKMFKSLIMRYDARFDLLDGPFECSLEAFPLHESVKGFRNN
jgi:hypothetical protein